MKFTRNGSVQLMAGVVVGVGAIVVACGGDDSTGTTTPADGGSTSSSGTTSSSGATTSSSGGSSGTASSSGTTTTDGGGTDAATEGGGKKANGEGPCASGGDCVSGECFVGKKESYCSIKCDNTGDTDPKCEAMPAAFSGECNNNGYCKPK
jgi:hypothetical protein